MKVEYIRPFIDATQLVMQTMVNLDTELGSPQLRSAHTPLYDVSSIVGLSGDLSGAVVVSYPRHVAEKIASSFIGVDVTAEHPDFADAIGELGNMIAGNAKKDFHGRSVSISIPNVVLGSSHAIFHSRDVPCITIPVSTKFGNFAVDVSIKLNEPVTTETTNRSREEVKK